MDVFAMLRAVAHRFDESRLAPAAVADRALDALWERRKAVAAADPTWSAIEALRATGRGTKLLLSDDLDWADWTTQHEIEEQLVPDPMWAGLARRVRRWTARAAVSHAIAVGQRATRGFADRDVPGAGHYLARVTAGMLDRLAMEATGCPGGEEFPDVEAWVAALRRHARALRLWDADPAVVDAQDAWLALSDSGADEDVVAAARSRWLALEAANEEAAIAAMVWVGEHLPNLWD